MAVRKSSRLSSASNAQSPSTAATATATATATAPSTQGNNDKSITRRHDSQKSKSVANKKRSAKAANSAVSNKDSEAKRRRSNAAIPSTSTTFTTGADTEPPRPWYWLMKAEPDSRIVKGRDVKFSIDDLAAATSASADSQPARQPAGEPWDGVRNPVARNNMRAMRKGERALFYHSNCKVPGAVGVMEIVREHSVDESAFDPRHPYFDEKSSRDKPKWSVVHVAFGEKFPVMLSLKEMQAAPELSGMQLLRQSRLSVSKVTRDQWECILRMVAAKSKAAGGSISRGR